MPYTSEATITINRPVERVWEALMNPENLKFWLTGFVSVEHISGEIGKTGSVSRLKFLERDKELEVTETAILVDPNLQYTFKMTSIPFDTNTDIRLIASGNSTELIQTVQFFPKQIFMKIMMPLIKGAMKRRMESELNKFKDFVESSS